MLIGVQFWKDVVSVLEVIKFKRRKEKAVAMILNRILWFWPFLFHGREGGTIWHYEAIGIGMKTYGWVPRNWHYCIEWPEKLKLVKSLYLLHLIIILLLFHGTIYLYIWSKRRKKIDFADGYGQKQTAIAVTIIPAFQSIVRWNFAPPKLQLALLNFKPKAISFV